MPTGPTYALPQDAVISSNSGGSGTLASCPDNTLYALPQDSLSPLYAVPQDAMEKSLYAVPQDVRKGSSLAGGDKHEPATRSASSTGTSPASAGTFQRPPLRPVLREAGPIAVCSGNPSIAVAAAPTPTSSTAQPTSSHARPLLNPISPVSTHSTPHTLGHAPPPPTSLLSPASSSSVISSPVPLGGSASPTPKRPARRDPMRTSGMTSPHTDRKQFSASSSSSTPIALPAAPPPPVALSSVTDTAAAQPSSSIPSATAPRPTRPAPLPPSVAGGGREQAEVQ